MLDSGVQTWWIFGERVVLAARAFKVGKSLQNKVVLPAKRISNFLHISLLYVVYRLSPRTFFQWNLFKLRSVVVEPKRKQTGSKKVTWMEVRYISRGSNIQILTDMLHFATKGCATDVLQPEHLSWTYSIIKGNTVIDKKT